MRSIQLARHVAAVVAVALLAALLVLPGTADAAPSPAPSTDGFQTLGPIRVHDTRISGDTLHQGGRLVVPIAGSHGVPSDATAVVLNVTGLATSGTYVSVFPAGASRPHASNLNLQAGEIRPNQVYARLGRGGAIEIYNQNGATDVVVDVAGYFSSGGSFRGINPLRLADTRLAHGGPTLGQGDRLDLSVLGQGGMPTDCVGAVALNVTVTNPTASGYVTAWPAGVGRPTASTLNFARGDTAANFALLDVGLDGMVSIYNHAGSADVIVDLLGWTECPSRDAGYRAVPTVRWDSRVLGTAFGAGESRTVSIEGFGSVPAIGVGAVVANVTVTQPTGDGYLTLHAGGRRPLASSLNFVAGQTIANNVTVPVGPDGTITVYNHSRSAHVVIDVLGWHPTEIDAVDETAPHLRISDKPNGTADLSKRGYFEIGGTVADAGSGIAAVAVETDGGSIPAQIDSSTSPVSWTARVAAPRSGVFDYRVVATDRAGNGTVKTTQVRVRAPAADDIVVSDRVVALTEDDADRLVSYDQSTGSFVAPLGSKASRAKPGDTLLVRPGSERLPEGAMRYVRSVSTRGGLVLIETVQADLTDIFVQGKIDIDEAVAMSEHAHASATKEVVYRVGVFAEFTKSGKSAVRASAGVRLEGELSVRVRLTIDIGRACDFCLRPVLEYFDFTITPGIDLNMTFSASGDIVFEDVRTLTTQTLTSITIPTPVPLVVLVFTPRVTLRNTIELRVGVEGAITCTLGGSFTLGVRYANRRWSPVRSRQNDSGCEKSAGIRIAGSDTLTVEFGLRLFDAAGPAITLNHAFELSHTINSNRSMTTALTSEAYAGALIDVKWPGSDKKLIDPVEVKIGTFAKRALWQTVQRPLEWRPVSNEFECDGVRRHAGTIVGARARETIRFDGSSVRIDPAKANDRGELKLNWRCTESSGRKTWTVKASGTNSLPVDFGITGVAQPAPPRPANELQAKPVTDPVPCDGSSHYAVLITNADPNERLTLRSPRGTESVTADDLGRYRLGWRCTDGEGGTRWTVTVDAARSESVTFHITGRDESTPPPPPHAQWSTEIVRSPVLCDGKSQVVAEIHGPQPGERIELSADGRRQPSIVADRSGIGHVAWSCTHPEDRYSWRIEATGPSGDVRFAIDGIAPPGQTGQNATGFNRTARDIPRFEGPCRTIKVHEAPGDSQGGPDMVNHIGIGLYKGLSCDYDGGEMVHVLAQVSTTSWPNIESMTLTIPTLYCEQVDIEAWQHDNGVWRTKVFDTCSRQFRTHGRLEVVKYIDSGGSRRGIGIRFDARQQQLAEVGGFEFEIEGRNAGRDHARASNLRWVDWR